MLQSLINKELCDKVTDLLSKGYQVNEVANEVGIARRTYSRWLERGHKIEELLEQGEKTKEELNEREILYLYLSECVEKGVSAFSEANRELILAEIREKRGGRRGYLSAMEKVKSRYKGAVKQ